MTERMAGKTLRLTVKWHTKSLLPLLHKCEVAVSNILLRSVWQKVAAWLYFEMRKNWLTDRKHERKESGGEGWALLSAVWWECPCGSRNAALDLLQSHHTCVTYSVWKVQNRYWLISCTLRESLQQRGVWCNDYSNNLVGTRSEVKSCQCWLTHKISMFVYVMWPCTRCTVTVEMWVNWRVWDCTYITSQTNGTAQADITALQQYTFCLGFVTFDWSFFYNKEWRKR